MHVTRIDLNSIQVIAVVVAWFMTLSGRSCDLIMGITLKAKVLKDCCVDDMDEEKLIETVWMFSCQREESSMAFKDYTIQFNNGCGHSGVQSAPIFLAVAEL